MYRKSRFYRPFLKNGNSGCKKFRKPQFDAFSQPMAWSKRLKTQSHFGNWPANGLYWYWLHLMLNFFAVYSPCLAGANRLRMVVSGVCTTGEYADRNHWAGTDW